MRGAFGEDNVEGEALEVEDVGHDSSVSSCCGSGYEVDKGLMIYINIKSDAVVQVCGKMHDDVVHCHRFDFCYTVGALRFGQ